MKASDTAIVHFRFNAWAKYNDWKLDAKIPPFAARKLGCKIFPSDFVLEGGAIDTNGEGALLTIEECLLDDNVQSAILALIAPRPKRTCATPLARAESFGSGKASPATKRTVTWTIFAVS